ncbi:BTAD domain-containing putative transcriptional regulator [Streptomyces xiamenensis]|uniref:AfsR/SARP family transcriptional regulator n=1 Tax=Streptomyces xiamenensis TaxID=408015 RepID=UPI0036E8CA96
MPEPRPMFRLLGPVEIRAGAGLPPRAGKPQAVLAALLLRPGRAVSVDTLSEVLWDGEPPLSALSNLRTYVHRLRRALPGDGAGVLLSHPGGGYELRLSPHDSDHLVFARLVRQGRDLLAAADPRGGAVALRRALELWHSEHAAAGLERRGLLVPELAHLDIERLRALEDLAGAWLDLGEPRHALDTAWQAVSADPLRTRGWQLVLRAHHRLGEHGRLTASYEMARAAFREALGRDPDAELAELRERLMYRPYAGAS